MKTYLQSQIRALTAKQDQTIAAQAAMKEHLNVVGSDVEATRGEVSEVNGRRMNSYNLSGYNFSFETNTQKCSTVLVSFRYHAMPVTLSRHRDSLRQPFESGCQAVPRMHSRSGSNVTWCLEGPLNAALLC